MESSISSRDSKAIPLFLFPLIVVLLAPLALASLNYDNPRLPHIIKESPTIIINQSSSGSGSGSNSSYNATYNNLIGQMCPVNFVVNGTLLNGTLVCTADQTAGGTTLLANYSNFTNSSYYWDNLDSPRDINFSGLENVMLQNFRRGDIYWYNGSKIVNLSSPAGLPLAYHLRITTATDTVSWSLDTAGTIPTLAQVLGAGETTSGNNIVISDGDNITMESTKGYLLANYSYCNDINCSITFLKGDVVSVWAKGWANDTASSGQQTDLIFNRTTVDTIPHRNGAAIQRTPFTLIYIEKVSYAGTVWVNLSSTTTIYDTKIMIEVKR